jgi:hypothetical protein
MASIGRYVWSADWAGTSQRWGVIQVAEGEKVGKGQVSITNVKEGKETVDTMDLPSESTRKGGQPKESAAIWSLAQRRECTS